MMWQREVVHLKQRVQTRRAGWMASSNYLSVLSRDTSGDLYLLKILIFFFPLLRRVDHVHSRSWTRFIDIHCMHDYVSSYYYLCIDLTIDFAVGFSFTPGSFLVDSRFIYTFWVFIHRSL